jgi:hypothetical protein
LDRLQQREIAEGFQQSIGGAIAPLLTLKPLFLNATF